VHGEADDIIPVEMGRRLFAAANEPKAIVTIPGGDMPSMMTARSKSLTGGSTGCVLAARENRTEDAKRPANPRALNVG
jgi:fermentation-respiration switch protein FrsA (DUF1100 family)